MFYLRLARGYRAPDLGRWLLTTLAAAVVAAFLLRSLGRAMSDPLGGADPLVRLLWCLPPLAAVAWFAAVAARSVPARRPERIAGLTAAGAGSRRIRALIAGEVALACTLGSVLTLLVFLVLRNDIAGPSLAPDLGMGVPLPAAAPVTLLALVPLTAGIAAACAVPVTEDLPGGRTHHRTGFGVWRIALPIGVSVIGAALELIALRPGAPADGRPIHLPAGLGTTSTAALGGWAAGALGLALLTGPLLAWAGRLLALGRPTPLRLLAGRGLTAQAPRLGAPLAVLTLAVALVLTTIRYWIGTPGSADALPAVEACLVLGCAAAAVIARLAEVRTDRRDVTEVLLRLGTSPRLLFGAVALRTLAVGTTLLLTGGATAALAAAGLR
ncbi:hypothetical protein BX285_0019 [Streptomyces sp. 1114.5]|uniref:hypothetical protein n=1 Tax=unclassified Streptomyces TaxID=2593676 RepID=UPI000BCD544F|nr:MULTISPECIES: hypothetical protein [unclassified Streptomyces]RKT15702.1 hypothetical protein BX285_0019 [Streptomyces sp. 1114.5]SOB81878.1 hypothetical protein SAMN06272789_2025 [Streptomyces sp. 1331.2]